MTSVQIHLNYDDNTKIKISEEKTHTSSANNPYHVIDFNNFESVFLSPEQLKDLCDKASMIVYGKTMEQAEDVITELEFTIDEKNQEISDLIESDNEESTYCSNVDFYQAM